MQTFVTFVHIATCLSLVGLVLLQSGKGAEISASLSGSSQTVFGTSAGVSIVVRITQALAAIFFITSLGLAKIQGPTKTSVFDGVKQTTSQQAPAPANPGEAPAASAPAAPATAPAQEPAKK